MSGTIVTGTPPTHVQTDAPIVPRRCRSRCRNANVWRGPAEIQRSGDRAAVRRRRGRYRRRGRRDRGGAADRLRRPQMRRAGSVGRGRRPLHHRYRAVRRAVRSRCARAPYAGNQTRSCGLQPKTASTSIRRRPGSGCASRGVTPAKARWRTCWRRWCAPTAPSPTSRARPTSRPRRRCRRTSASGARLSSSCWVRISAARTCPRPRPPISLARPSATCRPTAGKASARWSRSSPPTCRCGCRRRPPASIGAAAPASRSRPRRERSMPAPSSSRPRPTC